MFSYGMFSSFDPDFNVLNLSHVLFCDTAVIF